MNLFPPSRKHLKTRDHRVVSGNKFRGDAVIIQTNNYGTSPAAGDERRAVHVFPFPQNEGFVARAAIAEQLEKVLPGSAGGRSAAIWGLGGSGKSQIALDYAYTRSQRDASCAIFWAHADTIKSFVDDYNTIATKLGLTDKPVAQSETSVVANADFLMTVRRAIERQPRWLLVVDNVDDLSLIMPLPPRSSPNDPRRREGLLNEFIPFGSNGTVLWVSQDGGIVGSLVGHQQGVRVSRMTPMEGCILLHRTQHNRIYKNKTQAAEAVVERLAACPQVISQAGEYMRRTSTSIPSFLERVSDCEGIVATLEFCGVNRHRRPGSPVSILRSWEVAIQRLLRQNPLAYHLLYALVYFDHQCISYDVMENIASRFAPLVQPGEIHGLVVEALRNLEEYSFIVRRKTDNDMDSELRMKYTYSLHGLVQDAAQDLLAHKGGKSRERRRHTALAVISSLFPSTRQVSSLPSYEKNLSHAVKFFLNCLREGNLSPEERKFGSLLASYLLFTCNFDMATLTATHLFAKASALYEANSVYEMEDACLVARTRLETDSVDEVEQLATKYLRLSQQNLGEAHPATLALMGVVASVFAKQQRTSEAFAVLTQTLRLWKSISNDSDPNVDEGYVVLLQMAATFFDSNRASKQAIMASLQACKRARKPPVKFTWCELEAWELRAKCLVNADRHDEAVAVQSEFDLLYPEYADLDCVQRRWREALSKEGSMCNMLRF